MFPERASRLCITFDGERAGLDLLRKDEILGSKVNS
jgi:hypothetical protein